MLAFDCGFGGLVVRYVSNVVQVVEWTK
jgi:hypothetical protein